MSDLNSISRDPKTSSRSRRRARPALEAFEPRTLLSLTAIGNQLDIEDNEFTRPAVSAKDSSGNFAVAWADTIYDSNNLPLQENIYVRKYNSSDAPIWSSPVLVSANTTFNRFDETIAMDARDDIVVGWWEQAKDDSSDNLIAQRLDTNGNLVGSRFQVNTVPNGGSVTRAVFAPQMTMAYSGTDEGYFAFTWTRSETLSGTPGYRVYARSYNASGTPLETNTEVAVDTVHSNAEYSSIGMDSNGNFEVAWGVQQNYPYYIYLEHFTPTGSGGGQVNTGYATRNTVQTNRGTSLSMDPAGDFVVTWANLLMQGQQSPEEGVWAYYKAGLNSGLITVEDYGHTIQGDQSTWIAPTVALSPSTSGQRFVVAWSHAPNSFSTYSDIFASQYVLNPLSSLVSAQQIDMNPISRFAPKYWMDFVDVGADPSNNVSFVWRGAYDNPASYGVSDFLWSYANGGSSPSLVRSGSVATMPGFGAASLQAGPTSAQFQFDLYADMIAALLPGQNWSHSRGRSGSPSIRSSGADEY